LFLSTDNIFSWVDANLFRQQPLYMGVSEDQTVLGDQFAEKKF